MTTRLFHRQLSNQSGLAEKFSQQVGYLLIQVRAANLVSVSLRVDCELVNHRCIGKVKALLVEDVSLSLFD